MVEFYELINSDDEGNYIIYLKDFIEYVVEKLKTNKDLKDVLILIREEKATFSKELINYKENNINLSDRKVTAGLDMLYTLGLINVKGKKGRIIVYEITDFGELCLNTYIQRINRNI